MTITITGPEPVPPATPSSDRMCLRDDSHTIRTRKGLFLVDDAVLELEAIRHRSEGWVSMFVTEKFTDQFGEPHERTIRFTLADQAAVKLAKFMAYGD